MRNKTLTSKVISILIITMIFLLILLLGSSYVFYLKSKQDFVEKKDYAVNICVQSINEHLNKVETQLTELMLNTIDETDLSSTNDLAKHWAKSRINNAIKNKLAVNTDVDCFFVESEAPLMLKGYNTQIPPLSRNYLMNYLLKNKQLKTHNTKDSYWEIVNIKDESFFYLAYKMEGYIVGAFVRVAVFDDALKLINDQDIDSYSYVEDNRSIYTYEMKPAVQDSGGTSGTYYGFLNENVVIKGNIPSSNITFVGNYRIKVLDMLLNNTYIMLAGIILIFFAMLLVFKRIISQYILNPIEKLLNGMQHVANGRFDYQVMEETGSSEFNELNKSFNSMVREIGELRISRYEQQIRDAERQIEMLRMQLKPHFYLNSITTVRSMTYQDKVEDIRAYLDALSDHIRYMLSVNGGEVMLSEELAHIENYIKMQQIKFPNSVTFYIGCGKELQNKKVGHLFLFTVIENSFKYAMNLYDTLIILIQCEAVEEDGFKGYRVIIEDNGKGFPEEQLKKFAKDNEAEDLQDGKHIGLSNIKKTLELKYVRNDLLRLKNIEPHGARVEIWIPDAKI